MFCFCLFYRFCFGLCFRLCFFLSLLRLLSLLALLPDVAFGDVVACQRPRPIFHLGFVEHFRLFCLGYAVSDHFRAHTVGEFHDSLYSGIRPALLLKISQKLTAEHYIVYREVRQPHQRGINSAEVRDHEMESAVSQLLDIDTVFLFPVDQDIRRKLEAYPVGVHFQFIQPLHQFLLHALFCKVLEGHIDGKPFEVEFLIQKTLDGLHSLGKFQVKKGKALVTELSHLAVGLGHKCTEIRRIQPRLRLEECRISGFKLTNAAVIELDRPKTAHLGLNLFYSPHSFFE